MYLCLILTHMKNVTNTLNELINIVQRIHEPTNNKGTYSISLSLILASNTINDHTDYIIYIIFEHKHKMETLTFLNITKINNEKYTYDLY